MLFFLFCWFAFAFFLGVTASNRGRSGIGWAFLAIFFSPVLTGLLLLALPRRDVPSDIATMAMVEATPEGSRARQLLAQREADLLRRKENSPTWLIGSESNRPWSKSSTTSAPKNKRFGVIIGLWVFVLIAVALAIPKQPTAIATPKQPTAIATPKQPTAIAKSDPLMDCINTVMMLDRSPSSSWWPMSVADKMGRAESACRR